MSRIRGSRRHKDGGCKKARFLNRKLMLYTFLNNFYEFLRFQQFYPNRPNPILSKCMLLLIQNFIGYLILSEFSKLIGYLKLPCSQNM